MHRGSLALAASFALACSTHRVDERLPPCGPDDQTFFARCVADGIADCHGRDDDGCTTL